MRISRCTPLSVERNPKAFSPSARSVADFSPAPSPGVRSNTVARNPLRSAQRRYIRSNISAQSCDSMPPAPDFVEERIALGHVGLFFGEVKIRLDVAQHSREFGIGGDNPFGDFSLLENFLGLLLVLPEIRM